MGSVSKFLLKLWYKLNWKSVDSIKPVSYEELWWFYRRYEEKVGECYDKFKHSEDCKYKKDRCNCWRHHLIDIHNEPIYPDLRLL